MSAHAPDCEVQQQEKHQPKQKRFPLDEQFSVLDQIRTLEVSEQEEQDKTDEINPNACLLKSTTQLVF